MQTSTDQPEADLDLDARSRDSLTSERLLLCCLAFLAGCADEAPRFEPGPAALELPVVNFNGTEFVGHRGLQVYRSTDAKVWTVERVPAIRPTHPMISDGNGSLVGVDFLDDDLTEIYLSTDSRSWEAVATFNDRIGSFVYGNGIWLGFAFQERVVVRSLDGREWTRVELAAEGPSRLTFVEGLFYLHGSASSILVSVDGESWEEKSLPIDPSGTIVIGLEEIGGVLTAQCRTFISRGETRDFILRDTKEGWVRQDVANGELFRTPVKFGSDLIASGSGRLVRLLDAETWRWETVLHLQPMTLRNLVVGNDVIVADGSPIAVSTDQGATWSDVARPDDL